MKRWFPVGMVLILLLVLFFARPAMVPEKFTGDWYSANCEASYTFENGIVYKKGNEFSVSEQENIHGAYIFCKKYLCVFITDLDGLEEVTQLYLVRGEHGDVLCEDKNGSGTVYLFRAKEDAMNMR